MKASFLWLCVLLSFQVAWSSEIHVSTTGNDLAIGTLEAPLQTIEGARQAVRRLKMTGVSEPIDVVLHAGTYQLFETWKLNQEDSGTEQSPVRYRAANDENVVLCGTVPCTPISSNLIARDYPELPESSINHVCFYEFGGNTLKDSFLIPERSLHSPMQPAPSEVIFRGRLLPRAKYPNSGWEIATNHTITPSTSQFSSNQDVFVHVLNGSREEDSYRKLINLDTKGIEQESLYRIENSITHLDSPGEWYLDSSRGRLLWWPVEDRATPYLTNLETLVSMYDTEHVSIEGLTLEGARVQLVEIVGGNHCQVKNCNLRCAGNVGLNIYHGTNHHVIGNEISMTGSTGVRLEGGDLDASKSAGHTCEKNYIHHTGQYYRTQRPAIEIIGVGIAIRNNEISDLSDSAILVAGSQHLISENDIRDVCQETLNSGAIAFIHGHNSEHCEVSANQIQNIGWPGHRDVYGIYLTPEVYRANLIGNVFRNCPRAIVVRATNDHEIRNNVILDAFIGVQLEQSIDGRPTKVQSNAIEAIHQIVVENDSGLIAKQNTRQLDALFVDHRNQDLRIRNPGFAQALQFHSIRPISNRAAKEQPSVFVSK